MSYDEWLENWLENYIQPATKSRTYTRYKEIAEKHIIPRLGMLDVEKITPLILQGFVTDLLKSGNLITGKGLSANSVNAVITVIKGSLKSAHSLGIIEECVGEKIKRPRYSERRVESFSVSEQKQIEEYILGNKSVRLFGIVLCLYTGLRIGELLALEWADVDMHKSEMRINKTCYYGKDDGGRFSRITYSPKTRSSVRIIPIPRQLVPHLREIKKKSRSTHVVSNGESFVSIRAYQSSFSALLRKLKIRHRGFHSLRHTFATRALECGMDVKTLSEILGHKSPMVTLNRYAHSQTEHKRAMMNKLGNLL